MMIMRMRGGWGWGCGAVLFEVRGRSILATGKEVMWAPPPLWMPMARRSRKGENLGPDLSLLLQWLPGVWAPSVCCSLGLSPSSPCLPCFHAEMHHPTLPQLPAVYHCVPAGGPGWHGSSRRPLRPLLLRACMRAGSHAAFRLCSSCQGCALLVQVSCVAVPEKKLCGLQARAAAALLPLRQRAGQAATTAVLQRLHQQGAAAVGAAAQLLLCMQAGGCAAL